MRQSTIEKRTKAGKIQYKSIVFEPTGTRIIFIDAPNADYIPYLNLRDGHDNYIGSLDPQRDRKALRQLQRWVNKILGDK